ncbi:hypothetical protein R5R35_011325 [Gryllus longicercus]|uniref:Multivesicular body subunit 12A n=1 Tax=Gryllus longicercus TaxID=2509291 RepID=A0AAN9W229_9ORTH
MMHQVYKTLPDDRPITSIHVVEDPDKCPPGFFVVSRTHDQDSDADLWREGRLLGRRVTRYLCLSKSEGIADYIVETVVVTNEKEIPPDGYSVLTRTADSEQRAWRKRQLCYKLSKPSLAKSIVTDIIILSRMKRAPEGFSLAGDINGVTICYKCGSINNEQANKPISPSQLKYSITPTQNSAQSPPPVPPRYPKPALNGVAYQPAPVESPSLDYMQISLKPSRPAPKPPGNLGESVSPGKYATIATYSGLEGVPFILSSSILMLPDGLSAQLPVIKSKTKYQLDQEYHYDFRIERQT